jgi:hypothetical protein
MGDENRDEPRASGAKNGGRRHADCRALARLPEHETGDGPGRRKPNEETGGASSPTEACPRSAQKLTRKRKGGSSAKTSEKNTATRTRNNGGSALRERARTKKSTAVVHDSRR